MVAVTQWGPMGCSEHLPPAQWWWGWQDGCPEEGLSLAPVMALWDGGEVMADGMRGWYDAAAHALGPSANGHGAGDSAAWVSAHSVPGSALMSVGARQC